MPNRRGGMNHLLDALDDRLAAWLAEQNQPRFRARQIRKWVARRVRSFEEMTDLPAGLRRQLSSHFVLRIAEITRHLKAADGTEKLLFGWPSGGHIEGVLLREGERRTICISTQVGCAMGCVFCASGLAGLERNLTTGEIIEQALELASRLAPSERLSHVVVMGMGEPLANLANLLPALDFLSSPDGLGISARRITVSTVGLPSGIRRLAQHARPYRLAISLHAPNDALRSQIVPVNARDGVAALLAAADDYFAATGRRLTFEYTLLGGINDGRREAEELAALLRGRCALLNVIPYNPVPGLDFRTPTPERVAEFRQTVESAGVTVQVRKRKGRKIDAACGQLRRAILETPTPSAGVGYSGADVES